MKIRELLAESHISYARKIAEGGPGPTPEKLAAIKQQILDYRKEGWNDRDISELMGKNSHWVSQVIHRYFPDLRQLDLIARAVTDDDKAAMEKQFRAGQNLNQIAKSYGIDSTTVKRYLDVRLGKGEVQRIVSQYMKPDRKWTPEEKAWAAEQYAIGVGPTAIASIFNKTLDKQPSGTEEMTKAHVTGMMKWLPNFRELQRQYQANKNLHREPELFTTKIYRAGRIDPEGRKTDWSVGRGYK